MLTRAKLLHQRPIFFRAGEDVLSSFGVTKGVKFSTLADLPVFPMKAHGLALTTAEIQLTETF